MNARLRAIARRMPEPARQFAYVARQAGRYYRLDAGHDYRRIFAADPADEISQEKQTQEQIAAALGVARSTVEAWLATIDSHVNGCKTDNRVKIDDETAAKALVEIENGA